MSYASVAAQNAPPYSEQPKPDSALLNTEPVAASRVADDTAKVTVVAPGFKEYPKTVTGEGVIATEYYGSEEDDSAASRKRQGSFKEKEAEAKKKARKLADKAKHELDRAEEEGEHLWDLAKEQLLRPGVAGGLVGLINVGLIGSASYALYRDPYLRRDKQFLSTLAVSSLAILGIEGFAAEKYASTERGQAEAKRAKAEGAAIWRHTREVVLRPGVFGGIIGVANIGILGTVGWFAYVNWDAPRWDRKVVSAVSAGLLTLWGVEGVVAESYRETH